MQKYVVAARFDEETNAVLERWKRAACEEQNQIYADAAEWPPHITIAAYEDVDVESLCQWTALCASKCAPLDISFGSLGIFPHGKNSSKDVIYAAPANSLQFTEFYYGFHQKLDEFCGSYGWNYTIACGHPVFHSTIAICDKQDFACVFEKICSILCPLKGKIIALEVYENPKRFLYRAELNNETTIR